MRADITHTVHHHTGVAERNMWTHLRQRSAAAGQPYRGKDTDHTVAQGWGLAHVAVALAVAHLIDAGWCATAETVSRAAGCSRATAAKYLQGQSVPGSAINLCERYDARPYQCGDAMHVRAIHYRPEV